MQHIVIPVREAHYKNSTHNASRPAVLSKYCFRTQILDWTSSVGVTRQKNYQHTKVNKNVLYDHELHRCKVINMTSGGTSEKERPLKKTLKNYRR